MCRSVDQPILVSETFANVEGMRGQLISVGRYALRGVGAAAGTFHTGSGSHRLEPVQHSRVLDWTEAVLASGNRGNICTAKRSHHASFEPA